MHCRLGFDNRAVLSGLGESVSQNELKIMHFNDLNLSKTGRDDIRTDLLMHGRRVAESSGDSPASVQPSKDPILSCL